jgi:hypothetical protein
MPFGCIIHSAPDMTLRRGIGYGNCNAYWCSLLDPGNTGAGQASCERVVQCDSDPLGALMTVTA